MRCFVCDEPATDIPDVQEGRLVDCAGCGWYRISGTALQLMRNNVRVFNVPRSKDWLRSQRERGTLQPLIEAQNNLWD